MNPIDRRARLAAWPLPAGGIIAGGASQVSVSLPKTCLEEVYDDYLINQESAEFIRRVARRYTVGTLERLARSSRRGSRRAAVLALGFLGASDCNPVLGAALKDTDRLTRTLAENAIRSIWLRANNEAERQRLAVIVRLNCTQQYAEALRLATELIVDVPTLAEAWNQRAIASYCLGQYRDSISDCLRVMELNPYHFGAAGGLGQCHVQLDELPQALAWFRRALKINPNLEGVRASVQYLERSLKKKP